MYSCATVSTESVFMVPVVRGLPWLEIKIGKLKK
jgi:hypothetical protein